MAEQKSETQPHTRRGLLRIGVGALAFAALEVLDFGRASLTSDPKGAGKFAKSPGDADIYGNGLTAQRVQEIKDAIENIFFADCPMKGQLSTRAVNMVVPALHFLENLYGGWDDRIPMERMLGWDRAVHSYGPLQVQAGAAADTFTGHADKLTHRGRPESAEEKEKPKFPAIFAGVTKEEIETLSQAKDDLALRNRLDLSDWGGVLLGLVHYVENYNKIIRESTQAVQEDYFEAGVRTRSDFLRSIHVRLNNVEGPTYARLGLADSGRADMDQFFRSVLPTELSMANYCCGPKAHQGALIQGMINDWLWLERRDTKEYLSIDGDPGKKTQKLLDEFFSKFGQQAPTIDRKSASYTDILQKMREVWSANCEKPFLTRLEAININSRSAEGALHADLYALMGASGELTKARVSYAVPVYRALLECTKKPRRTGFGEDRKVIAAQHEQLQDRISQLYSDYLDKRSGDIFKFLDAEEYNKTIRPVTNVPYRSFVRIMLAHVARVQFASNLVGEIPSTYEPLMGGIKGIANPPGRAIRAASSQLDEETRRSEFPK